MNANGIFHLLVDAEPSLLTLIGVLQSLPKDPPSIYVDLEGSQNCVYLIDVHTLQTAAFNTATADGTTLKSVLESSEIIKVFFDLRNDSDALYHHFGVRLSGVEDIQLMENAARTAPRRYVNGLERCITKDAPISLAEKKNWKAAKEKGLKLFEPKYGGSYDIFNERPINTDIEYYCVIDVQFLPLLRNLYWGRLSDGWKTKVMDETKKRVLGSQSPAYQPHSEEKKFGPWGGSPHKFLSGANEDEVSRISFHMVGSLFWYPKIY